MELLHHVSIFQGQEGEGSAGRLLGERVLLEPPEQELLPVGERPPAPGVPRSCQRSEQGRQRGPEEKPRLWGEREQPRLLGGIDLHQQDLEGRQDGAGADQDGEDEGKVQAAQLLGRDPGKANMLNQT